MPKKERAGVGRLLMTVDLYMNASMAAVPRLEARVDKKRLTMMIGIAVTVYAGIVFFAGAGKVYNALLGIAVVTGVVYGVKELFQDGTRVIIGPRGVLDKRNPFGTIAWADIERVYVVNNNSVNHICLDLVDEEKYFRKSSKAAKWALKFTKAKTKVSPFNINMGTLDVAAEEVYRAIERGVALERGTKDSFRTEEL
jgi:hypothetical protein